MSCNIPPEVLRYIELVEADQPKPYCSRQHALVAHIRKVFAEEDIFVDTEQLRKYMGLVKYFPYDQLFPWEEFIVALWNCTYKAPGLPRWSKLFCMVGRGAGKDGLIAAWNVSGGNAAWVEDASGNGYDISLPKIFSPEYATTTPNKDLMGTPVTY